MVAQIQHLNLVWLHVPSCLLILWHLLLVASSDVGLDTLNTER